MCACVRSQGENDIDAVFRSIGAHCEGLDNVLPPIELDAAAEHWGAVIEESGPRLDAILACNLLHIAPYCVTEGVFRGAGRLLKPGAGHLIVYGPFMVDGMHTSPSNEAFDSRLVSQNADWGVRCATQLTALAVLYGLAPIERIPMPTNNFMLVFRKNNLDDQETAPSPS